MSRRQTAIESFQSASETIGPITHEMSLFAITRGQFSMLDCILHVLTEIGQAKISVWTWAIADYEVEAMEGLMSKNSIIGGRLIVDTSADKRSQATINKWRTRFGEESVRIVKNHAKIARVWNEKYRVLLRGSMNLNWNPRFEQLDITEGGPDFELVQSIEEEFPVLPRKYSNADVESASKLNRAWEYSQLQMFQGKKTWAK
jgi:hypothetical protein